MKILIVTEPQFQELWERVQPAHQRSDYLETTHRPEMLNVCGMCVFNGGTTEIEIYPANVSLSISDALKLAGRL